MSDAPRDYPRFADLPRPDDSGLPLAWGVWGAQDALGTLNHIRPETVRAAAALIGRGERFNLDLALHVPYGVCSPGGHRRRTAPTHTILDIDPAAIAGLVGRDDRLDSFWPQGSSQWDALTHIGDPRHGFYNGVQGAQITGQEGTRNGIENMARFGIAGRAVLADFPRYCAGIGRAWAPNAQHVIAPAELEACLAGAGVAVQPGDVLLVRTGWLADYLAAPVAARDAILGARTFSGLSGGAEMWEWLWERRVAAVAADQPTVEVWPLHEGRPSLHLAIARLGLTLGELFDLEALAQDCARDGRYAAFFTSSPLNLRGGVGSPPNAMAIK
jgi:kynurenine formamidase